MYLCVSVCVFGVCVRFVCVFSERRRTTDRNEGRGQRANGVNRQIDMHKPFRRRWLGVFVGGDGVAKERRARLNRETGAADKGLELWTHIYGTLRMEIADRCCCCCGGGDGCGFEAEAIVVWWLFCWWKVFVVVVVWSWRRMVLVVDVVEIESKRLMFLVIGVETHVVYVMLKVMRRHSRL